MSDTSRFTDDAFELVTDKDTIKELEQKADKLKIKTSESKTDDKKIP